MNDVQRQLLKAEEFAGFTADDFLWMTKVGAFSDMAGKIELVDGVITRMSPAKVSHFHYTRQVFHQLNDIFGYEGRDGYIVGQVPSFQLSTISVREPDVAILRSPELADGWIPGDHLLLAVNVADTSLADDKGPRRLCYARALIPNYWVVDVNGRVIEAWSDPADGDYRQHRTIPFGEPVPVPGTDQTITLN